MVSVLGLMLAPHSAKAKAAAVGLMALLAAPAAWAAETGFAHIQGSRPVAALGETPARRWRNDAAETEPGLLDFLRVHAGGGRFLAATANARQAAPLIIATGAPVLAMGGFEGSIPIVTPPKLQFLVVSGQLRFVLLEKAVGSGGRAGQGRRYSPSRTDQQRAIQAWVHQHGELVEGRSHGIGVLAPGFIASC
jgi:4-amino-4-deoxy-L-arabinose transferase-like glycosyltransferase